VNSSATDICIQVDPTNPGQYFACCGLLELAGRLCGWAEGRFERNAFVVDCEKSLPAILADLLQAKVHALADMAGIEVKPLLAPLRLFFDNTPPAAITLSAWMTLKVEKGVVIAAANPPWNFWSGQQTSLRIWVALTKALRAQLEAVDERELHELFFKKVATTGRFGFDPEAAWNALDAGYSPNEQGVKVYSSPAIELLAAIGLERFRPRLSEDRQAFAYATWPIPLASIAAAAVAGLGADLPGSRTYRCRVVSRGSYAALTYSIPENP
jgi:CRISPR-associated protein Csx14